MEKKDVNELPSQFIYKVPRTHKIFQNRSIKFGVFGKQGIEITDVCPIPNNEIICDWCNTPITDEKINLVVHLDKFSSKTLVDQALCERCKKKKYSELIVIGE